MSFLFTPIPILSEPHVANLEQPRWVPCTQWIYVTERNPNFLRDCWSLIPACLPWTKIIEVIILLRKQSALLLGRRYYLYHQRLLIETSLRRQSTNAVTRHTDRPWRITPDFVMTVTLQEAEIWEDPSGGLTEMCCLGRGHSNTGTGK